MNPFSYIFHANFIAVPTEVRISRDMTKPLQPSKFPRFLEGNAPPSCKNRMVTIPTLKTTPSPSLFNTVPPASELLSSCMQTPRKGRNRQVGTGNNRFHLAPVSASCAICKMVGYKPGSIDISNEKPLKKTRRGQCGFLLSFSRRKGNLYPSHIIYTLQARHGARRLGRCILPIQRYA